MLDEGRRKLWQAAQPESRQDRARAAAGHTPPTCLGRPPAACALAPLAAARRGRSAGWPPGPPQASAAAAQPAPRCKEGQRGRGWGPCQPGKELATDREPPGTDRDMGGLAGAGDASDAWRMAGGTGRGCSMCQLGQHGSMLRSACANRWHARVTWGPRTRRPAPLLTLPAPHPGSGAASPPGRRCRQRGPAGSAGAAGRPAGPGSGWVGGWGRHGLE